MQGWEVSNFPDTFGSLEFSPFFHWILGYQLFYWQPCREIFKKNGQMGMNKNGSPFPPFSHQDYFIMVTLLNCTLLQLQMHL